MRAVVTTCKTFLDIARETKAKGEYWKRYYRKEMKEEESHA